MRCTISTGPRRWLRMLRWGSSVGLVLLVVACTATQRANRTTPSRLASDGGRALTGGSPVRMADADSDGIPDAMDRCPDTAAGKAVDSQGCVVPVFIKLTLQYADNESGLPAYSEERLAAIGEMLRDNPDARLQVDAHTDNRGDTESNLALSRQRALTIQEVLETRHQVPSGRITALGHGASSPLVSNDSERGQARNRRAELVLSGSWRAYTGDDLPGQMLSLNFGANSTVLTPQSRKSLEAIARYLHKHPDVQARVTARHGGSAGGDQLLAQSRAQSIQTFLARQYGLAPDQLAVVFLDAPVSNGPGSNVPGSNAPAANAPTASSPAASAAAQPAQAHQQSATAAYAPAQVGAICFDTRQTDVQGESAGAMEALGRMLSTSPHLRCILAGHTDDVGAEDLNLEIARQRAESVRDYLISRYNLKPDQLEVQAYGEAAPLVPNDTEEGRRQNRRVEYKVLVGN